MRHACYSRLRTGINRFDSLGPGIAQSRFKLPVGRTVIALPCPALPCPALPCPALPCPAKRYLGLKNES
jgi:hypothetical protein